MDARNLQKMMRQMSTEELPASSVKIELSDGSALEIRNPSVVRMKIMGQTTYQVSGETVESGKGPGDEGLVMTATGASKEAALSALADSGGDIAKAILALKEKQGDSRP